MELILEQYEAFVKENKAILNEKRGDFILDASLSQEYITALAEAIEDKDARNAFLKVAQRELEFLKESRDLLLTEEGQAWAIMYFPILADVYQTPSISNVLTPFTTSQARVAIPRRFAKGEIIGLDGSVTEVALPSSQAVRPNKRTDTISAGKTNLFSLASITDKAKINQRYFAITKLTLNDNDGSTDHTVEIPVVIKPDFSGNFSGEAKFTSAGDSKDVVVYVSGNVNFNTGDVVLNVSIDTASSDTITFTNATVEYRVNVYGADKGKVRIKLDIDDKNEIYLDEDSTFFIELIDEKVQDFKDIYNVDLLASISEVVKLQFQLNKDADVADSLKLSEPEMSAFGNTASIDFSSIPTSLNPANISDVFSLIVPKILAVAASIEKNAHVTPQYLVTDRNTAIVLETLQQFAATQLNTQTQGKVGPVPSALQYTRFTILKSDSVEANKIYVVYKANVKSAAAMVDLIYKPLYVHKSDVNGVTKQYLKSRTAVEVVDPRKLGVVTITNNPYV